MSAAARTSIRSAQSEVDDAEGKAKQATLNLAAYRNRHAVLDPVNQATLQMEQIGKLQEALIAEKTQLSQLRAFAPQNPQIPTTEARIRSLQSDIDAITSG
jgi:capsular polysaccharide transport system permease protein